VKLNVFSLSVIVTSWESGESVPRLWTSFMHVLICTV